MVARRHDGSARTHAERVRAPRSTPWRLRDEAIARGRELAALGPVPRDVDHLLGVLDARADVHRPEHGSGAGLEKPTIDVARGVAGRDDDRRSFEHGTVARRRRPARVRRRRRGTPPQCRSGSPRRARRDAPAGVAGSRARDRCPDAPTLLPGSPGRRRSRRGGGRSSRGRRRGVACRSSRRRRPPRHPRRRRRCIPGRASGGARSRAPRGVCASTNPPRSRRRTRAPASAKRSAANSPAGPAPTTIGRSAAPRPGRRAACSTPCRSSSRSVHARTPTIPRASTAASPSASTR